MHGHIIPFGHYTYTHTRMHSYIHAHIHECILTQPFNHSCIHAIKHIYNGCFVNEQSVYLHFIWTHIWLHACVHTHACIPVQMWFFACTDTHTCMCTSTSSNRHRHNATLMCIQSPHNTLPYTIMHSLLRAATQLCIDACMYDFTRQHMNTYYIITCALNCINSCTPCSNYRRACLRSCTHTYIQSHIICHLHTSIRTFLHKQRVECMHSCMHQYIHTTSPTPMHTVMN